LTCFKNAFGAKKLDKRRCFGDTARGSLYAQYHDNEWGVAAHDDHHLFEMLVLEGAQAGLNWETILNKREGYRHLFHGFDPKRAAKMTDEELEALKANPAIIRNRRKIFSVRQNARIFLELQREFESFDSYVWRFVKGKPIVNHWQSLKELPAESPESIALSKDLKKRGMSFVGPTIMYAFMQAVGMVDDHLDWCFCRLERKNTRP
jgi:DNA-3-methyladenine glycosylase I